MSPYVTYNNEIGVRLSFLVSDEDKKNPHSVAAFSYDSYKKKALRYPSFRLRAGKGKGNEALIRWVNLPDLQTELIKQFGHPKTDHNPIEEFFSLDGRARVYYEGYKQVDGSYLRPDQISQYTINASVLNALGALFKARLAERRLRNGSTRGAWQCCVSDCNAFNAVLKQKYEGAQHTLPTNYRRLQEALREYDRMSYSYLLDGRRKNQAAAKVSSEQHLALLEQLLRKHNNFDNDQIASFYNIAAGQLGWKEITSSTVANYRAELGLYVYAASKGLSAFRNKKAMQIKRSAPSASMAYWTLDGWDVELLYQRQETNKAGHQVTTYHNRLTVVVVMDPVAGVKYPVGYAIGSHETPGLIFEAMRNAANHTRELFGDRYKPLQLQSDRYALKKMTPLYEAMTKHFTPARVSNAKSKVIEPYFLRLNKMCQTFYPNWSGFGVTADKESQPNEEYLNKIHHSFPNEHGCREQIRKLIEMERADKAGQYLEYWNKMPAEDRLPLTNEEYLYLFGTTHEFTNRLQHYGFAPTIMGQSLTFDNFDPRFRELAYMDWAIKYDPEDLSSILVLNAKTDIGTRKVKEIIGTYRFELSAKYTQPMALYDRKEGDAEERQRVIAYNEALEQAIIDRGERTYKEVEKLFVENPQLNDTLTKMVLVDSQGQHKDQRNATRALPPISKIKAPTLPESLNGDEEIIEEDFRQQYGNNQP